MSRRIELYILMFYPRIDVVLTRDEVRDKASWLSLYRWASENILLHSTINSILIINDVRNNKYWQPEKIYILKSITRIVNIE